MNSDKLKRKNGMELLLLLLVLWLPTAEAQVHYAFKLISIQEGLANNTVHTIYKDSQELLWIGTRDGLNCYNGYEFALFQHSTIDSNSLLDNNVYSLTEDSKGRIWAGTQKGVAVYDPRKERFVNNLLSLSTLTTRITGLHPLGTETLWITTTNAIYRYHLDSNSLQKVRTLPNITAFITHQNTFYIASTQNKVWILDPYTLTLDSIMMEADYANYRKILFADQQERLWVGTKGKGALVYALDEQRRELARYATTESATRTLPHDIVFAFYQDPEQNIWVGTDGGGIQLIDKQLRSYETIQFDGSNKGLSSNAIYSIMADKKHGLVYIGTFGAGINVYQHNPKFITFHHELGLANSLSYKSVLSFAESSGQLLIGTDGGGLNLFTPSTHTFTHIKEISGIDFRNKVIKSLYVDEQGRYWLGTYADGLYVLGRDWQLLRHYHNESPSQSNQLPGNHIWNITPGPEGRIWLAIHEGGIANIDPQTLSVNPLPEPLKPEIASANVLDILFDQDQNLWIATGGKGLFQLEYETQKLHHYHLHDSSNSGLKANDIRFLYQDKESTLWIGSNGSGLFKRTKDKSGFLQYTVESGLPNNTIHGITSCPDNNLWISTNRGIAVRNTKDGSLKIYDEGDGLQGNEFNSGAIFQDSHGNLFFGGSNGFSYCHPEKISINTNEPRILITSISLFNEKLSPDNALLVRAISYLDTLELPYNKNSFSFTFVALNYQNPQKNQYRYRLLGFEDSWREASKTREAFYTNIDPGNYVFQVIASNNDGLWTSQARELVLIIRPPLWQTTWFRLLALLIALLVLVLLYRIRVRHLHQTQKKLAHQVAEKTKEIQNQKEEIESQRDQILEMAKHERELNHLKMTFFTHISHELKTPLTLILGPLSRLVDIEKEKEKTALLKLIQGNADKLHKLILQIMQFRSIEYGTLRLNKTEIDLTKKIDETCNMFTETAKDKKISLQFITTIESCLLSCDEEKIEMILQNLISNALKFTLPGGKIEVFLEGIEKSLQLVISDTGIGIPAHETARIFDRFYQTAHASSINSYGSGLGLSMVKELVSLHQWDISVSSELEKGSTFSLSIPYELASTRLTEPHTKCYTDGSTNTLEKRNYFDNISDERKSTILIVDDNPDIRQYLRSTLSDNYKVLEAKDGKEALESCQEKIPDLIVSDLMMPVMDGMELLTQIKGDALLQHIPCILLTAKDTEEDMIRGLKAQADDYIAKPFNMAIVVSKINNLIASRELLIKKVKEEKDNPLKEGISVAEKLFMQKIKEVLDKHIDKQAFGTSELAAELGMSRTQLFRNLKKISNEAPNVLIRNYKLRKGAQILLKTNKNINEVAFELGFSNYNYFTKCFTDYYKLSPSEYLKKTHPS